MAGTLLLHFLFAFAIARAYYVSHPVSEKEIVRCGSSPEEAKSLGCHWDLFSFGWYPDPCYDKHLNAEFIQTHHETFLYRLPDNTSVLTSDVEQGRYPNLLVNTSRFHDTHCTYEWLRLIRSLAEGRPLDKKLAEAKHAHHCSMRLLMTPEEREDTGSEANVLFASCGITADQMYEFSA